MFAFGVDQGNASIKAIGPSRLVLPHALVRDQDIDRSTSWQVDGDPLDYLHCEVSSPTLMNRTTEILAGCLATREYPDRCAEVREGELKRTSERHHLLTLVALAAGVQLMDPKTTNARLSVAASLPIAEFDSDETRHACQERLRGTHHIEWVSTPRWQGRRLTLEIQRASVVPEGAIAYAALCAHKPDWVKGVSVVIDVGARSIDWATFASGGRFQRGLSGGTHDGGIALAADRLLANCRQAFGPTVGRGRLDVLNALQLWNKTGGTCVLYGRGRAYDCTELAALELARLAVDVAKILTSVLERVGRVDHVAVIGGGGILLRPFLEPLVECSIYVPDEAAWLNAEGLHARAIWLSQQPLY